jgi:hypothetical protein
VRVAAQAPASRLLREELTDRLLPRHERSGGVCQSASSSGRAELSRAPRGSRPAPVPVASRPDRRQDRTSSSTNYGATSAIGRCVVRRLTSMRGPCSLPPGWS